MYPPSTSRSFQWGSRHAERQRRKGKPPRRTRRALCSEPLEDRRLLSVDLGLVKDINTVTVPDGSDPGEILDVNGVAFFAATTLRTGRELWKSDGTESGTILVKDISAGIGNFGPEALTRVGRTVFFTSSSRDQLWKSDGTEPGTVLVKDSIESVLLLTNVNGILFFVAEDVGNGTTNQELWKSDGTAAGTVRVKDIVPAAGSSFPRYLTNVGGTLFFIAYDGTSGDGLWKSDGTEAGTVLVKNISPLAPDSQPLVNVGGTLFFNAYDDITGAELWKSDGTEPGTVLVKDIFVGNSSNPYHLTNVNGTLYFVADNGVVGRELWKSDGTETGTVLVKDILPSVYYGAGSNPRLLTNVGGTLFFRALGEFAGVELWKSDGTEAGTVLVKDLWPGSGHSYPSCLTDVGGTLYFCGYDGSTTELWKSDGTEAGTVIVKDLSGPYNQFSPAPHNFANVAGTLFFSANDGSTGQELWKSDGTEPGTVRVRDIRNGTRSSIVGDLLNMGGTLYFAANDGSSGGELWKSDGTEAGTMRVKDIYYNFPGSGPRDLTEVDGTLFFSARGRDQFNFFPATELWKSDGTEAGTVLVKDIIPGGGSSDPRDLINVGGTLFFIANDGSTGDELWRSDGTEAGTVRVKDIVPGGGSSMYLNWEELAEVDGTLYFVARDGTSGFELWKSDGTEAGTVLVKDISPGPGSSGPTILTNVGGTLYFSAMDKLWKSDGTEAGTVLVKDIDALRLVDVNGTLYFCDPFDRLFKSDGTEAGTVLVKGFLANSLSDLTNVAGTLYFRAADVSTGRELWKSDGTEAGTVLVKDILPGPNSSGPANLTNVDGTLYFSANDGLNGVEFWVSDGTAAGTALVEDIFGGDGSASPLEITLAGDRLFVSAVNASFGYELWSGVLGSRQGDFDRNGLLEENDIDALVAAMVAGAHPLSFDLDNDALVDSRDLDCWLVLGGAANLPSGNPYLPGDANLDGNVDGSDFNLWNSHKFTFAAAWSQGDFNADGSVDGADFNIWNSHKFTSVLSARSHAENESVSRRRRSATRIVRAELGSSPVQFTPRTVGAEAAGKSMWTME